MGNFNSGFDPNKINTANGQLIDDKHGNHVTDKIHTTMNNKRKKKKYQDPNRPDQDIENGDINMMAQKAPLEMGIAGF